MCFMSPAPRPDSGPCLLHTGDADVVSDPADRRPERRTDLAHHGQ